MPISHARYLICQHHAGSWFSFWVGGNRPIYCAERIHKCCILQSNAEQIKHVTRFLDRCGRLFLGSFFLIHTFEWGVLVVGILSRLPNSNAKIQKYFPCSRKPDCACVSLISQKYRTSQLLLQPDFLVSRK